MLVGIRFRMITAVWTYSLTRQPRRARQPRPRPDSARRPWGRSSHLAQSVRSAEAPTTIRKFCNVFTHFARYGCEKSKFNSLVLSCNI